jgi:hypothetical protein
MLNRPRNRKRFYVRAAEAVAQLTGGGGDHSAKARSIQRKSSAPFHRRTEARYAVPTEDDASSYMDTHEGLHHTLSVAEADPPRAAMVVSDPR